MKVNNENFDKVLNKLVAATRSPRGRFTAENSWRLLESRLLKRRIMKRFWMRTASAAAVVLLLSLIHISSPTRLSVRSRIDVILLGLMGIKDFRVGMETLYSHQTQK